MLPADTPVLLALLIVSIATSGIVALRYFASSGLFAWLTRHVRPGLYDGQRAQIAREIRWSLIATLIYGAPAGIVLWGWNHWGWTQIYADFGAYPLWYLPLSVLIYLFVQDTWFYWTHRAMHAPKLFRILHKVHHNSRPPTAWTAMSFHWSESLIGAVLIPAAVFFIPIHLSMLAAVVTIATIMGVTNHMGWEIFPRILVHSALGRWVITASHHEKHHEEFRCNFGLYFRFWDRLCGTDRGLSARLARSAAQGNVPA
ncbi:sterol desaturase family protein [Erythrobacter insulae]|uniref:Sterol desaturase family protein n=1 Tax=Erythrobacter insulae TaxID=2584124 RepID=A0A547PAX0_9SPHN|nr:sterol desaturase family protein [Erythrobacter insulae]TRD11289.1 sterol desaturase family protein [Erythrobacter insulae]